MNNKCILCEFTFDQDEKGNSEMWSVLNHLADVHPYFTDDLKAARLEIYGNTTGN